MIPYRHIVWDWNGTLLDDVQAAVNSINLMLAARRLPLTTVARYRETFGFPVRFYYDTIGLHIADTEWDAVAHEFHANFLKEPTIRLNPAAPAVLRFCRDAGCGLSILSASEQSILDRMLADAGIAACFDHVMGVDNLYGHSKVEIGRHLMAKLAVDGGRVLFVGDTLHDHEVASALHCDCLLIADGHQTPARLRTAHCPMIENLAEFPAFFKGFS